METEDIVIIGVSAVGLYFAYKTLFKPVEKTAGAISDVVDTTQDSYSSILGTATASVNSWLDILNLKKDYKFLQDAFNKASQQINQSAQSQAISVMPKSNVGTSNSYSKSWLRIKPSNTATLTKPQTASEAIDMARNPYIKNVAIKTNDGVIVNKKPVSLPPSLLKIALGG